MEAAGAGGEAPAAAAAGGEHHALRQQQRAFVRACNSGQSCACASDGAASQVGARSSGSR